MQYPEHEKLKACEIDKQAVINFLEWLDEQQMCLAAYDNGHGDHLQPIFMSKTEILAKHFNIDTNKLENEKVHMLQGCRIARGEAP